MQHTIRIEQWSERIGPQVQSMAQAISACVHCGFCLPVCPTYQVLGDETDSPRGRIMLMKAVLENDLDLAEAAPYIDHCLGCLACAATCPSGVRYGDLLLAFEHYASQHRPQPLTKRTQHLLIRETLPYPQRFRSAVTLGRLARTLQGLLPEDWHGMLDVLPERLPPRPRVPKRVPASGPRRARAALLLGCVQQVLAPEINLATLRVLARNGVEVVIPEGQVCCGAILMHTGEQARARELARHNMRLFPEDADVILTNAAGCGSGMKDYPFLFQGLEEADQAQEFASRVRDVSQFLIELGLAEPPPLPQPLKVAYHDACHLAYAQGITQPPRQLLQVIPNLTLIELADGGLCCGSAGTYNLEQPEIAAELGQRKAQAIAASGGEAVAAANIGCMVQIRQHLKAQGKLLPVFHPLELLDMAYSATGEAL